MLLNELNDVIDLEGEPLGWRTDANRRVGRPKGRSTV